MTAARLGRAAVSSIAPRIPRKAIVRLDQGDIYAQDLH